MRTDHRDRSHDDPVFVRQLAGDVFARLLTKLGWDELQKDPAKVGLLTDLTAGFAIKAADRFMAQWVGHVKAWSDDGVPVGLTQVGGGAP